MGEADRYIETYPAIIVLKWGLNALFILPNSKHSAEDLFTLTSNTFRMVYKVDGNPQLNSRDWSMYSNVIKILFFNEYNYQ